MRTKEEKQCITDYGMLGDHMTYITVAEVIAELQKLDQERYIYVQYDGFEDFAPLPDQIDKDGDYVIIAG